MNIKLHNFNKLFLYRKNVQFCGQSIEILFSSISSIVMFKCYNVISVLTIFKNCGFFVENYYVWGHKNQIFDYFNIIYFKYSSIITN